MNDPANYRKMSEPFIGSDAAKTAVLEFSKELRELRQKHRIADVLCVCAVNIQYEDGEEGIQMVTQHHGLGALAEGMAAFALGELTKQGRESIAKLMKQ